jgi:hypothetical protein
MQNHLITIAASLIGMTTPITGKTMNIDEIALTAECRDNPACIYDDKDMVVDLILTNKSDQEIGLPYKYLIQKGAQLSLTDIESNKKISFRVSLTPPELRTNFVAVKPGEKIVIPRKILSESIRDMRGSMTNIIAKLGLGGLAQLRKNQEPVQFEKEVELRIRGRDTFDFENKK